MVMKGDGREANGCSGRSGFAFHADAAGVAGGSRSETTSPPLADKVDTVDSPVCLSNWAKQEAVLGRCSSSVERCDCNCGVVCAGGDRDALPLAAVGLASKPTYPLGWREGSGWCGWGRREAQPP